MLEPEFSKCIDGASMGASIALTAVKALNVRGYSRASFQSAISGAGVGVVDFVISDYPGACDKDGNVLDATKFVPIPSRPAAFSSQDPNGTLTGGYYGFADLAAAWLAPIYTRTSGTGTLTVTGAANR
jgi:hypothetical protein